MIGPLGLVATVFAAACAIFGVYAGVRAWQGTWPVAMAIRAAWLSLAGLVAANGLMVVALVAHDFSIRFVAEVGSRATPLLYTVASLWGALEGSILFWAGLQAGVTVLFIRRLAERERERSPIALAVLLGLTAFFALIVAGPGNPWLPVSPVPLDGPGPNPLLQNHPLMAFHPPLLYLGFVGLSVPFALTVDGLVRGRLDSAWLRLARAWTLGPWVLLTLGLMAGAWWSYAVLGWGGYWGWDPVENVALLPWLTATAFLHSAMIGRRGGALAAWNVSLIAASFGLTLFATLVTRSGLLDSVHAFTRSAIGPLFVSLLGAVIVGTVGLLLVRLPHQSPGGRIGVRGGAFLLNNLLLAAITATVLFGTVFPLLTEALANTRVSVGAPYFERIVGPMAVGLLVLVGIGPALPWGNWSSEVRRAIVPGAVVGGVIAVLVTVLGSGPPAVAGAAAGGFALGQSIWFLVGRIVPRAGSAAGRSRAARPARSRAIGGLLSHVGVAALALAVLASATGKREQVVTLTTGATAEVLGHRVTLLRTENQPVPNGTAIVANLRLNLGSTTADVHPALNVLGASTQAIATPAILPGLVDDVYVTLLDLDLATGVATVRLGIHPFVSWIWPSGAIIALGGGVAFGGARTPRRSAVARSRSNEPLWVHELHAVRNQIDG
ncbi:MAG: heme lyase CcmF/NrfE family subunit [Chloroflexota bacterium]|nr:MAG: heme lyase CcmF/NrfE family subunit [Chloroflexota bacterium]